jgi:MFS family permease
VFWVAVIPAFLALALIIFAVREPERPAGLRKVRNPLSLQEMKAMGPTYWAVVAIGVVFTLARFSEAFLVLRAQNVGIPIMWVPAAMVLMNVVYALAAYPAGALSDRTNRMTPLKLGLVLLIAADIALALMPTFEGVAVGVVLWGLHMGFTQGLFATLVADASPPELRGTAYGFFNLFTGLAMLAASIIAGALWDISGPKGTFLAGACFAVLAFVGVAVTSPRHLTGDGPLPR